MKIGIFYGSTTGNTEFAADLIAEKFNEGIICKSLDVITTKDIELCDIIIFGISTWNIGELEMTWEDFFPKLDEIDFTNKIVALFGMGDQSSYSDTFQDALGILYDKLVNVGATIIGSWPIDGYTFSESLGVRDGKFVGLALDQDNQPDLTDSRIESWVNQLKRSLAESPIQAKS